MTSMESSARLTHTLFSGAPPARTRIDRFRWSNLAQQYQIALDAVAAERLDVVDGIGKVPVGKSA